ncbi:MAG TPA: sugar phosphate nucleotidyltransferase [Chlamydiales bacterium]|nr:sugar phosphate nucleotidyltransferase [Chlamydiales bacterium]
MPKKKSIQVATIILAGGKGTRLHPLTLHHAKPAVSYGGRYRLIDIPISNSINSDFRQIFVIAQYLSGELQNYINKTYHFDNCNPGSIDILTPQGTKHGKKTTFSGTADAVRKNLPTILKSSAEYFLILSGDQLYNINFQSMVAFAREKKADLTIASIPVHEKEAERMGLLKINGEARIIDFVEKPKDPSRLKQFRLGAEFFENWNISPRNEAYYLGSMGIYVFTRSALIDLLHQDKRHDFGYHLIDTAVKNGKTSAFIYHGYWEDIGTVASYYEANLMLTHATNRGLDTYDEQHPIYTCPTFLPGPKIKSTVIKDSILCEGSIIEAKEITNCVIGLRSHVKKGTILRNTVMMGNHYDFPTHRENQSLDDFAIGENCLIEKAIIDENVCIGNRVHLVNKEKRERFDSKQGVFIRDGIIIVTAGTRLPNGFKL